MKNLLLLDGFRHLPTEFALGGIGDDCGGFFHVKSPLDKARMKVMASSGLGWDHVSVSRDDRCPSWEEMEYIKAMFFQPHETAMQLHVPSNDHVNCHPYCLHLWRPLDQEIPRPPSIMVGPDSHKGRS